MKRLIFLDESGDLGWSFDKPYKKGGSSRYLTIACVSLPENKLAKIERIVRGFYKKRKRPLTSELKSLNLNTKEKSQFIHLITELKHQNDDILFFAITIEKAKANNKLRTNPNTLYNYAVKCMLLDEIIKYQYVDFIPDNRCEKTNSRWNMKEYLQQMLVEKSLDTVVVNKNCNITPMNSQHNLALQFVDFYVAMVWAKYEFHDNRIDNFAQLNGVSQELLF